MAGRICVISPDHHERVEGPWVPCRCPTLAEPIVLVFDHDALDDDDIAQVRAALDEAHLVTVVAPSFSVTFRGGVVVGVEVDAGDEDEVGLVGAMRVVGSSSLWATLMALGIGVGDEVVVELVGDATMSLRSREAAKTSGSDLRSA